MCGIAGVFRPMGLKAADASAANAAAARLAHRGPDGAGFRSDEFCAVAFRRLAIIDLTPAGNQPFVNEDGSVWVVANGEIYNHQNLREDLVARGHQFRGGCDMEVLPHLYEEFGDECWSRLRGMFAVGLYDVRRRRLLLVRDPLGVKPLYFVEQNRAFFFASEPGALFAFPEIQPRLDPVALHEALTYRFVPCPRSGFADVEKLPPGNVLAVENGEPFVRAFWKLPDLRQTTARAQTFDEAVESLAERLRTAVKKRLTADVPIGLWLSGGLDSSLTAATWAAERPAGDEIPAFTAAFDWAEFDERDKAAACASRLGFAHQILNATPDGWTHLSDVIGGAGEPFFDSSALPTWLLAKETRRRVVVVLSGDGGDENFGGYERYLGMRLLSRWRAMPNLLRRSTRFLAEKLWGARRHGYGRAAAWLERCAEAMDGLADPDDALGAAYAEALSLFSEAQKRELYHPEFASEISGLDGRESFLAVWRTTRSGAESGQNRLARLMAADLRFYLPDDVLLKVDRMSMAHGLEVRSPFLDVDLAGWAAGLSDRIRLPAYKTKPMLRRLAQKKGLPGSVWRARKAGFGVPLDAWFRGPWKKKARALFQENLLSKEYVLRENAWKKLWDQHQEGKANHGERLYALVALDLWLRKFLKNGSSALVR